MKYNVAIIGGGPAGMMAAGRAGELGARVVLLEKNANLGIKLLATGSGRCNITNNTGAKEMIKKFGRNGKFLFRSLGHFGPQDAISFFRSQEVETKIEDQGRVFPESGRAQDVLGALKKYLAKSGVETRINSQVKDMISQGNRIEKIILSDGREIIAGNFIVTTGGKSYPATGSTGDGYEWARKLGHTIVEPVPALVPLVVKEKFVKELEGLSLKDVVICAYIGKKKVDCRRGEALFTSDGMSGPIVLDLSRAIGRNLSGKTSLRIDFTPDTDFLRLDLEMQKYFREDGNKMLKNVLGLMLPQRLAGVVARLSGINPEKKANLVSREERKGLLHRIKEFSLEIERSAGYERAIVTSGGIKLGEVDPKTMKSKLVDNLYFAGEVLDLDGPSGGYNLQVCWSTGRAAGENAARRH